MGACSSKPSIQAYVIYPPQVIDYKNAGLLFIEGPLALAGVQKHRKVIEGAIDARLSGFGGRKEDGDLDWVHTAIRETVEELFDVEHVSVTLIQQIRSAIPYREPIQEGNYVMMCCNFTDLNNILGIASKHIQSPLYRIMPQTLHDLLIKRDPRSTSEIGALALIPVFVSVLVDPDFREDLKKVSITATTAKK